MSLTQEFRPSQRACQRAVAVARRPAISRRTMLALCRNFVVGFIIAFAPESMAAADRTAEAFSTNVQPILTKYCYECHGEGMDKGGIKLDELAPAELRNHDLWLRVLKNVRSGLMPPAEAENPLPSPEAEKLTTWIKRDAFGLDPARVDPGRITVRRLNRVEYRNTIRELTGVDFDTQKEFPADDSGHGFDNMADVLTISPMLTEKYLDAAQGIIAKAVVTKSRSMAEVAVHGRQFETIKVDTKIPEQPKPPTPAVAPGTVETPPNIPIPAPGGTTPASANPVAANASAAPSTPALATTSLPAPAPTPAVAASATPSPSPAPEAAPAAQPAAGVAVAANAATPPAPGQGAPRVPGRGQGQGQGRRGRPSGPPPITRPVPTVEENTLILSYYTPATVATKQRVEHTGKYQVNVDITAHETYADNLFDLNKAQLVLTMDGETLLDQEFVREGYAKNFQFTFDRELAAGEHEFTLEVKPIAPETPQYRRLRFRLNSVTLRGPVAEKFWVKTPGYDRYFPRDVPSGKAERREYAREVLEKFATRAFRRPADPAIVEKLVSLAEKVYSQSTSTFETGVAQAMVSVLALPNFLFREERVEPLAASQAHPLLDEYSLASRLSYFLWSSMPDEELFNLARDRKLRANLSAQVQRMLNDGRAQEFVRNFAGQWLQARDITSVPITSEAVFLRDNPNPAVEEARETFRKLQAIPQSERTPEQATALQNARGLFFEFNRTPKPDLTDPLRRAMQQETEMTFAHVLREDRSLLELLDSNYTFLNEALAKHYGIEGVTGSELRKVTLPPDSPRGGVLTQGTVLAVTSNPTRTSPVKRGVFILEAILGTPPAPPPPNIPSLEDAAPAETLRTLNLRDTLALHAKNAKCASCHVRMDPLGLALENFNAMGVWRTKDMGQPVDTAGQLVTGEKFNDVRDLKRILATSRRHDFYHSISEKLLTYALGRSVEYYDTLTLDHLVEELEKSGGRPSVLLAGIINSPAFQHRRESAKPNTAVGQASPSTSALPVQLVQAQPQP